MFGKLKDGLEQLRSVQNLMRDENFLAFMKHPKIQDLFRDPEFQETLRTQGPMKIMGHPKLLLLQRIPKWPV